MEEWMLGVKATVQKPQPTLFSNWVVSHLPVASVLHYEMCTNVTRGSGERLWLIFVNSLIHTLWGRCCCRWMELRWVGWTDGEVNDYCCFYFPCEIEDEQITHVTGWRTAEHAQEPNQWNGKSFKCCCLVIVPLPCSCSCLALSKPLHLSWVHLLLPPTSCFVVVILILIVCVYETVWAVCSQWCIHLCGMCFHNCPRLKL